MQVRRGPKKKDQHSYRLGLWGSFLRVPERVPLKGSGFGTGSGLSLRVPKT